MALNDIIKLKREEMNLTQEELAKRLNVSRQAVSKWEAGLSRPSDENLKRLSKLFNIELLPVTLQPEIENSLISKNKKLKISLILSLVFSLIVVLSAILMYLNKLIPNEKEEAAITGVYFYDGRGEQIEIKDNWYNIKPVTTLIVTYRETIPEILSVYLTPTGTEMAEERKQIKVESIRDNRGFILTQIRFENTGILAHLEVTLEGSKGIIKSDLYNVYLE